MTDPDSNVYNYSYALAFTGYGNSTVKDLVTVKDPLSHIVTYVYENTTYPTYLTGIIDELGNRFATWTYDSLGEATYSTLAGGADNTSITYNNDGTKTVTFPQGAEITYSFSTVENAPKLSTENRLSSGSIPAATATFTYDGNGFLASRTDWNGNETTYTNNSRGLPTTIVEASGNGVARTTTITWSSSFDLPTEIDTARNTVTFTYDSSGNMTGRTVKDVTSQSVPYSTNGQTHVMAYTYDSLGHRLTATGPRTDVTQITTYTYDSYGNLSTLKDPLGHVTTYSNYTGRGQPQAMTDPNGTVTSFSYDARGRLLTRTVAPSGGDAVTTYTYDAAGLLYEVTPPDNTGQSFAYDDAHRLISIYDNFGDSIDYYLDNNNNPVGVFITDYPGTDWLIHYISYDVIGRKTQDYGSLGQTTTYSYDSQGNVTNIVDALAGHTTNVYDALNRLTGATDPLSHTTTTTYDSQDNRTAVKDPRSLITSYVYDGFGQVIQEVSPDRGTLVYVRDAAGNVTSETDARGVVTSYSYDALNRVTTQTYPADSSNNITFTYDATSGGNKGIGYLTGYSDESGSTALTYDERGNVTVKSRTIGSETYTTTYTYNLNDRLTQEVYPSGRIVTYTYDAVGNVSGVGTTSGATTTNLASGLAYYPFGPLHQVTYSNGVVGTFSYDTDYHEVYIHTAGTGLNVQLLSLYLDNAANPTLIYDSLDSTRTQTFTYDADSRLVTAIGKYGTVTYTYDANGNRTTRTAGGTTTSYAYPGTSNLLSAISGGATATYTYDAAGNTINDTSGSNNTYTYEKRGRYHTLTVGGTVTATYLYDAIGERVSKQSGGSTTHYQYDESGHLIEESNGSSGAMTKEYVWLNGMPIAEMDASGNVYYIHTDQLNAPQKLTDATPTIVWDRVQQPFGEQYSLNATVTSNLRFPGQYYDSESGLNYNMMRDYNLTIGRYIQPDPIGWAGTSTPNLNLYGYAWQNPVRFIDSLGLQICPNDLATQLEELGGGTPELVPTPKGATQFIFPNGTVMRFDISPGQYLPGQAPHINLEYGGRNYHIDLIGSNALMRD